MARLSFGLVVADGAPEASFDELAAWLAEHADLELERKRATSYQELATSLREGSSDIAWLPPVVYARIAEGVTPLGSIVRDGRTDYTSALVVVKSSPITSIEELGGARAGWVDPWSAAGFVVPRIELAQRGINPKRTFRTEAFFGTHRETMLALARGTCDVASTFARVPDEGSEEVRGAWTEIDDLDVRVLATFGSIPPDVVAVRRNLAPADYDRVATAFRRASADAGDKLRAVFDGAELRDGIDPGHAELRHAYERAVASGLID
jgi:phosphate/phosphite/phosphonate ABC transporter binding protein